MPIQLDATNLLLMFVTASLLGAWFARVGVRHSCAFDVSYWTAFSATLLAYAGSLVAGLILYVVMGSAAGDSALAFLLLPIVLLLVTAACYGFMVRYPRGEGSIGMGVGARVAIIQLGLTAMVGMVAVAALFLLK